LAIFPAEAHRLLEDRVVLEGPADLLPPGLFWFLLAEPLLQALDFGLQGRDASFEVRMCHRECLPFAEGPRSSTPMIRPRLGCGKGGGEDAAGGGVGAGDGLG